MSEQTPETPAVGGVSLADPPARAQRAPGRARARASVARSGVLHRSLQAGRAVAVGDRRSPWSDPLPAAPELARYAAEGDWCHPFSYGWRIAAKRWATWVAIPSQVVAHVVVRLLLRPLWGPENWRETWASFKAGSPPSLAQIVSDARDMNRPGQVWSAVVVAVATPLYALAAVLSRPGRLVAALFLFVVLAYTLT